MSPAADLEVVWLATAEADAGPYEPLLDEQERAARARLLRAEDRRTYTLAHGLLRATLSRRAGVPASAWRFERNDLGKPEIAGPAPGRSLRFNLSHTPGLVACVVAPADRYHEVGIDVEAVRDVPRLLALAARHFAATETAALCSLPRPDQSRRFFELWTLKEAWSKARGFGLAAPFDRLAFTLHPHTGEPRVVFDPGFPDRADRWRFRVSRIGERHTLALALAPVRTLGVEPRRAPPAAGPPHVMI